LTTDFSLLSAFAFDLRAEVTMHARSEENVFLRYFTSQRARSIEEQEGEWTKTDNPMFTDLSGSLNPPVAAKMRSSHFRGFTATFACGTRKDMHDLAVDGFTLDDPLLRQTNFDSCVREGAVSNADYKVENPDSSFHDEEVVVRMTINPLPRCKKLYDESRVVFVNETFNHAFSNFLEQIAECPEIETDDLPQYWHDEISGDDTFRAVLFGQGMPPDTMKEVLIDPADIIAEAF